MNNNQFSKDVLSWYDNNHRILPWRDNPTPYRVWISEIMLQQTKVNAVIPYFDRFMKHLPTVYDLQKVEMDTLLKLWEGLGYYNRARNLKKAAEIIVLKHGGVIPSTKEELEELPGIGEYTSGAILSIAFGKRYSAVDGNVLRVFARILHIDTDIKDKETKKKIKKEVVSLLPKRVGDFNQGLMEIGAIICLPNGTPHCTICPLQNTCEAKKKGTVSLIPIKRTKKKIPIEKKTVFIIEYQQKYVIRKRSDQGLLASMYEFMNVEGHIQEELVRKEFFYHVTSIKKLAKSIHVFSHKKWDMIGYHIVLTKPIDALFVSYDDLNELYSIPTAFKAYKEYIKTENEKNNKQ